MRARGDGSRRFPSSADHKQAFVRLFEKMTRVVGDENAMTVFTEGNYLSDGVEDLPARRCARR